MSVAIASATRLCGIAWCNTAPSASASPLPLATWGPTQPSGETKRRPFRYRPGGRQEGDLAMHFPNESARYRAARDRLLEKEIELRRQMEAVAVARRKLAAGRPAEGGLCVRRAGRRRQARQYPLFRAVRARARHADRLQHDVPALPDRHQAETGRAASWRSCRARTAPVRPAPRWSTSSTARRRIWRPPASTSSSSPRRRWSGC